MTGLSRRLALELAGFALLILAAVLLILLAGQLVRIGDLLLAAGPRAPWGAALSGGALILLEAALPLSGLLAAGLVYGRMRAEDAWVARAAVGGHPLPALMPAIGLGLVLGGAATGLAHGPVPAAVGAMRGVMLDAVAAALTVPDRVLALPGGGLARRVSGDAFWAALPGGSDGPTLIRAADAALIPGPAQTTLRLVDAHIWSPAVRIRVAEAHLVSPTGALSRRLGMFGPPNALATTELNPDDLHHRFTAHRRWALPAMAPLWAVLGALLGARLGGPLAVAGGAGAVAAAYWLLRTGELSARAGFMSPALAAWAPALVLLLSLAWLWSREPALTARSG